MKISEILALATKMPGVMKSAEELGKIFIQKDAVFGSDPQKFEALEAQSDTVATQMIDKAYGILTTFFEDFESRVSRQRLVKYLDLLEDAFWPLWAVWGLLQEDFK